ncbi:ubiquinone biosynthesis accessory factor UbiJ [Legionella fairfieldensis]|uniref:ubiquinone biosynthesis accessory factor UbiJ n=1 Tax=Legionella fairfieldensis TaxID=45064 RepID=UPI00048B6188|nr:SCP2 sterol-binding domain-containing protein [Legionella fairfieldensis]
MIKKYSLKALQKAINHALSLDESMPSKLATLDGKVLEIIIAPLNVNFYILFEQQKLKLLDEYNDHPDTIIHSNPLGLIRLSLLPSSRARSLFNDKIRLSGDVELGQQVKKLFDELDIDWEGHLAHFTGDMVAHQLGSLFRQGLAFKRQLSHSMRHNLSDYLHEELRVFPPREEIDDFFNDVDQITLDVERLQAHINQLLVDYEID